jgi:hypothetical protein
MKIKHDIKINIAIGLNRKDTKWRNTEMMWSEFLDKISTTTRTPEKISDFISLPKSDKDRIKDNGGYVAGYLKNGRRSVQTVVNRSMIALDADFADENLINDLIMLTTYSMAIYSTHSHTPEKPRYRIIIPLSRNVTPDEYSAISRKLASQIGMEYFVNSTYEINRLMYWPSTSSDGEYIFKFKDAPILNPEEILSLYQDWTDTSLWPTSNRSETVHKNILSKQSDPLEKKGIIGAFCRTYTIENAINTYLSDIYVPLKDNRYTYTKGTTSGGLIIYDNKFAYSHHGTDPCGGKLCNAFDLVRNHLFTVSEEDNSEAESISKMRELASQDENVKLTLATDRIENA